MINRSCVFILYDHILINKKLKDYLCPFALVGFCISAWLPLGTFIMFYKMMIVAVGARVRERRRG